MEFADYLQKPFLLKELDDIVMRFFPHKVILKKGGPCTWNMSPRSFILSNFGYPRARFAMQPKFIYFSLCNHHYGNGYKCVDDGSYVINGSHDHYYFNNHTQAIEFKLIYG